VFFCQVRYYRNEESSLEKRRGATYISLPYNKSILSVSSFKFQICATFHRFTFFFYFLLFSRPISYNPERSEPRHRKTKVTMMQKEKFYLFGRNRTSTISETMFPSGDNDIGANGLNIRWKIQVIAVPHKEIFRTGRWRTGSMMRQCTKACSRAL